MIHVYSPYPPQASQASKAMTDRDDKKGSHRLPVNPRRHKVAPEQRKRVATACNNCNVRRIKCSGEKPCKQCRSSSRECAYPEPVEKVTVPKPELDDMRRQLDCLNRALQDAVPDVTQRRDLLRRVAPLDPSATPPSRQSFSSMRTTDSASEPAGRQSFSSMRTVDTMESASSLKSESVEGDLVVPVEGRLLRDVTGNVRFFGETNVDVFLDSIKDYFSIGLQSTPGTFLSNAGLYQTYDSQSVMASDVDPLWLPSSAHMGVGLSELRHFIQDGNSRWQSGGLFWWGDLSTIPANPMVSGLETHDLGQYRHLAFYNAALAIACRATTKERPSHLSSPLCETYFTRAAMLVGNPLDVSRHIFGDAATLALMAFYLIEASRLDMAYMYIGAATRICLIEGAHRGLVEEPGKRVFWTVFVLDRWLAMLLGRPPSIPDEAIRCPLPMDTPGMPSASGLRAHVELSRISEHIMNQVHSIAPHAGLIPEPNRNVDRALSMLDEWRHGLPAELVLSRDGLSQDPSCCLLHMHHNHLLVVATRAWLLRVVQDHLTTREESKPPTHHIKICMAAARHNIRLARHLLVINQPRKLLHTALHLLLTSAICILMQELVYSWVMTGDEVATGHRMIEFALETFNSEANVGNLLGQDGSHILRELRSLVTRVTLSSSSSPIATSEQVSFRPSLDALHQEGQQHASDIAAWGELFGSLEEGWLQPRPT